MSDETFHCQKVKDDCKNYNNNDSNSSYCNVQGKNK